MRVAWSAESAATSSRYDSSIQLTVRMLIARAGGFLLATSLLLGCQGGGSPPLSQVMAKCQQPVFFEHAVQSPELLAQAKAMDVDITPRPAGSFICKTRPTGELVGIDQLLNDADKAQLSGDQAQADKKRAEARQRLSALAASHKTAALLDQLFPPVYADDTTPGLQVPGEVAFDWWMAAEEERAGDHVAANMWNQDATSALDAWAQGILNDPNSSIEDVLAAGADVSRAVGAEQSAPFRARALKMAEDQAAKAISDLPCPPTPQDVLSMMKPIMRAVELNAPDELNRGYLAALEKADDASIRAAAQDLPPGPSNERAALAKKAAKLGLDDLANQVMNAGTGGPAPAPPNCGGFQLKGTIPITLFGSGTSVTVPLMEITAHTCGALTGSHWTGSAVVTYPGGSTETYALAFDVPKGGGEVPLMPDTPDGDHLSGQITEGSQTAKLTYSGLWLDGEVVTGSVTGSITTAPAAACPK